MKFAVVLTSLSLFLVFGHAVAGPTLPEKNVQYFGTPRAYKPVVGALRQEEPAIAPVEKKSVIAPAPEKTEKQTGQPAWLLFTASVGLALAGTGMVLVTLRTRFEKKNSTARRVDPPLEIDPAPMPAVVFGAERKLTVIESEDANDEDQLAEEEDVLHMAQQYHRGRGEVELAMRMRSHQVSPLNITEKIRRAGVIWKKGEAAALAKRLGVGKGEIALAVRLRQVRRTAMHSEEVV